MKKVFDFLGYFNKRSRLHKAVTKVFEIKFLKSLHEFSMKKVFDFLGYFNKRSRLHKAVTKVFEIKNVSKLLICFSPLRF